ncbi:CubicO group peptidase (beta-lactamase class C family) [Streptomyces griseochromogenes]|uniref:CubicO group peptidase (Beta-lactamase class C family) n=1 Tax=Streptomyces griseochromogenes TaxID=68214 RepID=A0A1B1AV54_9ACTN|nr:serine hydrolase domain-containing protein [Streptomyces griseochromogenes]ANP50421.1 EstA family serine hydrolase [Streptomyces griseochromogenes]MBP2047879.1 CubicO group peptidase (beta-lactamase class C family) [Streptomyces griseochromogenes]
MAFDVHGTVAEGFEGVREEFAAHLAGERDDPGAQLVVYRHGRRVLDLWDGDGIDGASLTSLYSIAKGAAHLVVALLVQDGLLDLDREVAAYWPEFAAEGKDRLTLRELLEHRAGLVGDPEGGFRVEELADDRLIAARLAGRKPLWEPGSAYGYHAFVIGALTGEVVRRVTGKSIQELYEERIRAPYGLDYHLGLPAELEPRWVEVQPLLPTAEEAALLAQRAASADSIRGIAFGLNAPEPIDLVAFGNHPRVKALGPASSGGVGNARGVAGLYAAAISTVDGRPPLLTPETAALFGGLRTPGGPDLVTGSTDHFAVGFEYLAGRYPLLGDDAIGHSGATGSLGFADPASGVAYGYTRRRFSFPSGHGAALENGRLIGSVLRAAAGH